MNGTEEELTIANIVDLCGSNGAALSTCLVEKMNQNKR